jgi:hypothetical protein
MQFDNENNEHTPIALIAVGLRRRRSSVVIGRQLVDSRLAADGVWLASAGALSVAVPRVRVYRIFASFFFFFFFFFAFLSFSSLCRPVSSLSCCVSFCNNLTAFSPYHLITN